MRDLSSESLIVLPRLNVDTAAALLQALRAVVAAEKKLPKFLLSSWQRVEETGQALLQAARDRLLEVGSRAPATERKQADAIVDNAVGAMEQFLAAWARLPDELPQAQLARSAHQTLFPDGLGFLKLSFEQEWAQVERRITLLSPTGLAKDIAELGGTPFVTHLRQAQEAYGKALGLTAVPTPRPEPAIVRDPLEAFGSALRLYVLKVVAYRDPAEPETEALAERLVAPVVSWNSKPTKSGDDSPPTPPTPPAPPAP